LFKIKLGICVYVTDSHLLMMVNLSPGFIMILSKTLSTW